MADVRHQRAKALKGYFHRFRQTDSGGAARHPHEGDLAQGIAILADALRPPLQEAAAANESPPLL